MPEFDTPPRVVAIAGSLRRQSYNRQLLECAKARSSALDLRIADLADIQMFNEDAEALDIPRAVRDLWNLVGEADALLIATPEYNQSIPAVLKNAIDWLSRSKPQVLKEKPVAIMGTTVGAWGTRYAQAITRHTLTACGAFVMPTPQFFLRTAASAFAGDGGLTDQADQDMLDSLLAGFRSWIARLNGHNMQVELSK